MLRTVLLVAMLFSWAVTVTLTAVCDADEHAETSASRRDPQVVELGVELLPYKEKVDQGIEQRLARELIRQAILIAARDELGLATCDKTLLETVPRDVAVAYLMPIERADQQGKWHVKILAAGATSNTPTWEKTYDFMPGAATMYADMVPKLESDTRGEFLVALRAAGLRDTRSKVDGERAGQRPGREIEALLMKPDCVAQFAAVRAAHQTLAADGESIQWLGVLVRGYANLAALTTHYWNATPEVFTARAWLYAQRMVASNPDSDLALWHRAYAWALAGALHHALADLEVVRKRQEDANGAEATESGKEHVGENVGDVPMWAELIGPYCMCDRAVLKTVGEKTQVLRGWTSYLRFQLTSVCPQSKWLFDCAVDTKRYCPTTYGIDSHRLIYPRLEQVARSGGTPARSMFSRLVPQSLLEISDLPDGIRQLAANDVAKRKAADRIDLTEKFPPSPVPILLATQLRAESARGGGGDPSWSILASVIEEEQFQLVIPHFLDITRVRTTGRSMEGDVDAVWPMVKDHRYAMFIWAFRFNLAKHIDRLYETYKTLTYDDPRRNMAAMTNWTWYARLRDKTSPAMLAYYNSTYNYTLPALAEQIHPMIARKPPRDQTLLDRLADDAAVVAPHSDLGIFVECYCKKNPTAEQRQRWEAQTKGHPQVLCRLGKLYWEAGDRANAERCYQATLAAVLSRDATLSLAKMAAEVGDRDGWEAVLLNYLRVKEPGYWFRKVRAELVRGYIEHGQWRKARPYAEALGKVRDDGWPIWEEVVLEGLAEWDASEASARNTATHFAQTKGAQWYFWCKRTGRGDVEAARNIAKSYFDIAKIPRYDLRLHLGVYQILEADDRKALTSFRQALAAYNKFSCAFMVAQLARGMGEEPLRRRTLDDMMKECFEIRLSGDKEKMKVMPAGMAILKMLMTGDASDERLRKIDDLMRNVDLPTRCAFAYHVAKELDALGRMSKAEEYWRRSLNMPIRTNEYRTLSGMELVKRHRKSRPDDDVLSQKDLWPQPPEKAGQ